MWLAIPLCTYSDSEFPFHAHSVTAKQTIPCGLLIGFQLVLKYSYVAYKNRNIIANT